MAVLDYLSGRLQGVFGNLVAERLSPGIAKAMRPGLHSADNARSRKD